MLYFIMFSSQNLFLRPLFSLIGNGPWAWPLSRSRPWVTRRPEDTHQAQRRGAHDAGLHGDIQRRALEHLGGAPAPAAAPLQGLVDGHHLRVASGLQRERGLPWQCSGHLPNTQK